MDTFNHLWALLDPSNSYLPQQECCRRIWSSLPLQRQRIIYSSLREKLQKGEKVHPNPKFALEDNMNAQPEFLTGTQQDEAWDNQIPMVMVKYQERYRICTEQTQKNFELEFVRKWERIID